MIFSILDWEGTNRIGGGGLDAIWQHSIGGGANKIAHFEGGEFGIGGGDMVDNDEEEEEGGGGNHLSWGSQSAAHNFQRNAPNDAKMAAVLLCDLLGALCILLNAFVIVALIRNRRRVLVNVFYVLVLHCAIVDLIRGGCLIAWGMPHLLIHTMRSIQSRLLALKINQFTLVILRSCNLLTIFNLLVFTTNEFIVIKYPLHYRRYFRRRTVLVILAICWLVSLLFGIGSVFSNFFESAHSVMVLNNETTESIFREMDNGEEELSIGTENEENGEEEENINMAREADTERRLMMRFGPQGNGVTRRQLAGLSINVLSMLMIFVLCYVCLFTVLVCYGKILRTIRQFQKCGSSGPRRLLKESAEEGTNSNNGKRMGRTGSIYHKRSVHQMRTQQQQCQGTPSSTAGRKIGPRAVGEYCAATTDPASERMSSLKKKMSSPGSPQSGASGSADQGCGRCPNCQANAAADDMNRSRRCNSHRKWRSHLMSRHKYLIVIGTVLFVDILFLFPYSGIQMVALLHLNNLLATSQMTTLIRWGLQILIGVHSVCQPLCYFRMTEFRRLACCLGPNSRRFVGSGSSAGSIFAPPATYSRSAKSIGSMKAFGLTHEEDGSGIVSHKKSIVLGTLVSDGSPLVGDGAIDEAEGDAEKGGGGRRDRTNWVNPSVGERQMLLIAQRRKWTRNLSLLCKEEGEELEVFLSREYKRRGEQKHCKSPPAANNENTAPQHDGGQRRTGTVKNRPPASTNHHPLQKGGSLRNRSVEEEEDECEPSSLTVMEMEGKMMGKMAAKMVGSDGKLLDEICRKRRMIEGNGEEEGSQIGTDFGEFEEEKLNEQNYGNEENMEENLEQRMESGKCTKLLRGKEANNKGTANEERKEQTMSRRIQSFIGRLVGTFGRTRGWPRRRREWASGEEEEEEPTLLDSNWKRPGEVHQFRSHGQNESELRPKLSDLSGLRSNSVFTPPNQSACGSRQPSTQWGNSNCGTGSGHRKRSGWSGLSFSHKA